MRARSTAVRLALPEVSSTVALKPHVPGLSNGIRTRLYAVVRR